MTNIIKKDKKTPKKNRVEEVMTPAGKFYRIYSGNKFVKMLTEQEFEQEKSGK